MKTRFPFPAMTAALAVALSLGILSCARPAPEPAAVPAEPAVQAPLPGDLVGTELVAVYGPDELAQSIPKFFEHFPAPAPVHSVRHLVVRFHSVDFDGQPVVIRAQLFVPETAGAYPLYVFASGTTGIGDACAPSLEVPEERRWGWYTQNMLAYATLGHVVMFPDYTGFNDPDRPQRYFSKLAEGRMMLDAIRAANAVMELAVSEAGLSGNVFTAGYSQGGHAAMAAADLLPDYAPELRIHGVITYGSTNDVEALVREGPAYAPLIFYSYLSMYGTDDIQPERYLQDRWLPTFEADASTMAVDVFQAHYGFDYKTLYRPEFAASLFAGTLAMDYPTLAARLSENHTGLSGHGVPALVLQGQTDFIVTPKSQTVFVDALRAAGSEVEYIEYPGVSHRYTRMAGFEDSVRWMAALSGND